MEFRIREVRFSPSVLAVPFPSPSLLPLNHLSLSLSLSLDDFDQIIKHQQAPISHMHSGKCLIIMHSNGFFFMRFFFQGKKLRFASEGTW